MALSVCESVKGFEAGETASRRLSLRLLKQSLETSPTAVRQILQEVLALPAEKPNEFANLLKKTSLVAIINASREIVSRLDFPRRLDELLFSPESKAQLKERRQLHRIIAQNAWLFGQESHISVDDQDLTRVLKAHLKILGDETEVMEPVQCVGGSRGIIDLMLSRTIEPRPQECEHLIIELKRPKAKIDDRAANQIEKYALAVANDERFKNTHPNTLGALGPVERRHCKCRNANPATGPALRYP